VKLLIEYGAKWPDPTHTPGLSKTDIKQRMHQILEAALEGAALDTDEVPGGSRGGALTAESTAAGSTDPGEREARRSNAKNWQAKDSEADPITTRTDELELSELLPESHTFLDEYEGILRLDDARGPGCVF
jgi:hypothetical protein